MTKFKWIEKVYQVLEITDKKLIQEFLDYSYNYLENDLIDFNNMKKYLVVDNIIKITIETYDINNNTNTFFIKIDFLDNINRFISVDDNIIMEYLMSNNLIDFFPMTLILSKMDLLDRRVKDILLRNTGEDIDDLKVLVVNELETSKLIEFGLKEENIILINELNDIEVDLIYINDLRGIDLNGYIDVLKELIKSGVVYLGLQEGIDFVLNLGIKINHELTKDDILVITSTYEYKYNLKDYKGIITKKRSLEDFVKIIDSLDFEPEICLKIDNIKYWIVKYKDYITFQKSFEKERKFTDINDLIDNNNLFDFKNNWDLVDSIVIDEFLDL